MSESLDCRDQLHASGFRVTPQRLVVLDILRRAERHLSPAEIVSLAQQTMPGITESTVYRALGFLTEQGLILAAHVGSGQLVYEIAGHDHHHLICRSCGNTLEIEHELLAQLYRLFYQRSGYQIDSLHTTFFGICPDCQKKPEKVQEDI
jgi:Fe2+ or Zn2+ uptake regulation protein